MATYEERIANLSEERRRLFEKRLEAGRARSAPVAAGRRRKIRFTLFFFSIDENQLHDTKYRLVLEAARLADRHGLTAVWTPERHFHSFGGVYPSPAVLSSALAAITSRIEIRAGSVVLPLHHPVRVAEEWSVIDNLSNGRVGVSFASGWSSQDFIFAPDNYADRKTIMFRDLELVRRLWRGERVKFTANGDDLEVSIHPRPVQPELKVWVTSSGSSDTCQQAGAIGANLLTAMLRQGIDDVATNIAIYRAARAEAGHDPDTGIASVMMHTYLGSSEEHVRDVVREPLSRYLSSYLDLVEESAEQLNLPVSRADLSEGSIDAVVNHAINRYMAGNGLFGTPENAYQAVERLSAAGVDEVACLLDFGLDPDTVLEGIRYLIELRDLVESEDGAAPTPMHDASADIGRSTVLSPGQRQLWLLDRLTPGNPAYHVRLAARIEGQVDVELLSRAIRAVGCRHEPLRAHIVTRAGEPVQVIAEEPTTELRVLSSSEETLTDTVRAEVRTEFLLSTGPLWRAALISTSAERHVLALTLHHIVADGWSVGVLQSEIMTLYQAWQRDRTVLAEQVLPELPVRYSDVVTEQAELEAGPAGERLLTYWTRQLAYPPATPRALAGAGSNRLIARDGAQRRFTIGAQLTKALAAVAQSTGATRYMILLTAYAVTLASSGHERDIVIGCPIANRDRQGVRAMVGNLTNTIAIRVDLTGNPTLRHLLDRVRQACLSAYEHKAAALDKVVQRLAVDPRTPLFLTTFAYQPVTRRSLIVEGLTIEQYDIDSGTAKFPLSVEIVESGTELTGYWEYATRAFDTDSIGALNAFFLTVLSTLTSDPERGIESLYVASKRKEEGVAPPTERIRGGGRASRRSIQSISQNLVSVAPWGPLGKPLVITPAADRAVNLVEWATDNKETIKGYLLEHAGVLFKGFGVGADEFKALMESVSGELLEDPGRYDRPGPRENVYISTRYPQEHEIFMHNEMFWQNSWPMKIFFCCTEEPSRGGATLMADCRRVLSGLDPSIVESFAAGVLHVRNFGAKVGLLRWQDVFQTDDRAEVEAICQRNRVEWEWRPADALQVRHTRPAVARHPQSNEPVWFNYVALHHLSTNMTSDMATALKDLGPYERPTGIYYADGSEIPGPVVDSIREAYRRETVSYPWERGNVLLLDNMLSAHGREPYEGRRRILVGMTESLDWSAAPDPREG